MTLEEIKTKEEKQIFDRKVADIDAKALAISIIAFANADGGDIAIGISDKTRRIDGTDYNVEKVNELLRAPYDYCEPSVPVEIQKVSCIDDKGRDNHIIVMHIEPSMAVHANQAEQQFFCLAGILSFIFLVQESDLFVLTGRKKKLVQK